MIVRRRPGDLERTEFAAINAGLDRPDWDYPFALTRSRLSSFDRVLDFSGKTMRKSRRVAHLYPRLRVVHAEPSPDALSGPAPDFEKVFALRIFDDLDRSRRRELLAAIARQILPGGILVVTSGGSISELIAGCARHGLILLEPPRSTAAFEEAENGDFGAVFFKAPAPNLPNPKRVVLGLLTWNTREVSLDSLAAYAREAALLARLGHEATIVVADNGSTDGTREAFEEAGERLGVPHRFHFAETNRGSSIARNRIIDEALATDADYLLFMDGDIEVVPFSSFVMLRHLEEAETAVGCLGAYLKGQTSERAEASPHLSSLEDCVIVDDRDDLWVAWTQYGLFRRSVFEAGVRFDESTPFDRAGWGCEDTDLAFQMHSKGFYNQNFRGMTYLHRNVNSSIPILEQEGTDPRAEYDRRRRYVVEKWQDADLGAPTLDFLRGAQADPQF